MPTERKTRKQTLTDNCTHVFEKGDVNGFFCSINFFIVDGKTSSITTLVQTAPGEVVVTTEFARQTGQPYLAMKHDVVSDHQGWDRVYRLPNK